MDRTAGKVPPIIPIRKVNPILKKETHHQKGDEEAHAASTSGATNGGATTADGKPSPGKEKRHLKWDEHAIEEHDLLRGTRMKVRSVFLMVLYMICGDFQLLMVDFGVLLLYMHHSIPIPLI